MFFLKAKNKSVAPTNLQAKPSQPTTSQRQVVNSRLKSKLSILPRQGLEQNPEAEIERNPLKGSTTYSNIEVTNTLKKVHLLEDWFNNTQRNLVDFLAPGRLVINQNFIKIEDLYYGYLTISNLPREVGPGWLKPLLTLNVPHEVDIFVESEDTRLAIARLQKDKKNLYSTILQDKNKGRITLTEVEIALQDLEKLLTRLESGLDKLVNLTMQVTTWAETRRQLREQMDELNAAINRCGVESRNMSFRQQYALRTVLPDGQHLARRSKLADATTMAFSFPFLSNSLNMEGGVLWGINQDENSPVFVNLWNRDYLLNANAAILGTPGSGKSFFLKLQAMRLMAHGIKFKCVDPENEYERLAHEFGGRSVNISASRPIGFNLLELPSDAKGQFVIASDLDREASEPLAEKIISIKPYLEMMLLGTRRGGDHNTGFDSRQDALLEKALFDAYDSCGITRSAISNGLNALEINRATEEYADLLARHGGFEGNHRLNVNFSKPRIPTLADLHSSLLNLSDSSGMAENLDRFVRGAYAGFFSTRPSIFQSGDYLTVFKMREVPKEMEALVMAMIMMHSWNEAIRTREPSQFACDELWSLMSTVAGGNFVSTFARRSRKWGLSLVTATQQVSDFLNSPQGRNVLACSATLWIGKLLISREELMAAFSIDEYKADLIKQLQTGQSLLRCGDTWTRLQVIHSQAEYQIAETNPHTGVITPLRRGQ